MEVGGEREKGDFISILWWELSLFIFHGDVMCDTLACTRARAARPNQRLNELSWVYFYSHKSNTLQCLTLVWFSQSHC